VLVISRLAILKVNGDRFRLLRISGKIWSRQTCLLQTNGGDARPLGEDVRRLYQHRIGVAKIANRGSHLIQLVSKLTTVAILYFGAKATIAGDPALSRSNPRRSMIEITEYEAGLD
jgi:hypothetical protein